jgi:hypothetical protein
LLTVAWPQLTAAEQREAFRGASNQAQLAAIPKLLHNTDVESRRIAASVLLKLIDQVPDALRSRFNAFVQATFASSAGSLKLVAHNDDLPIIELCARTGSTWLVQEAVAMASRYRELLPSLRQTVLSIAANDPRVAQQLLADQVLAGNTTHDIAMAFEIGGALSHSTELVTMIRSNWDLFNSLPTSVREQILSGTCNSHILADLNKLSTSLGRLGDTVRARESLCKEQGALLGPVLRTWLGAP